MGISPHILKIAWLQAENQGRRQSSKAAKLSRGHCFTAGWFPSDCCRCWQQLSAWELLRGLSREDDQDDE